jgi:hypothetical protein
MVAKSFWIGERTTVTSAAFMQMPLSRLTELSKVCPPLCMWWNAVTHNQKMESTSFK